MIRLAAILRKLSQPCAWVPRRRRGSEHIWRDGRRIGHYNSFPSIWVPILNNHFGHWFANRERLGKPFPFGLFLPPYIVGGGGKSSLLPRCQRSVPIAGLSRTDS